MNVPLSSRNSVGIHDSQRRFAAPWQAKPGDAVAINGVHLTVGAIEITTRLNGDGNSVRVIIDGKAR